MTLLWEKSHYPFLQGNLGRGAIRFALMKPCSTPPFPQIDKAVEPVLKNRELMEELKANEV